MGQTARWGLRYPELTDVADGPAGFRNLAADLDNVAMDDQGTVATMPTSTAQIPGKKGRYWFATDQGILYRDNGSGWDPITSSAPVDADASIPSLRTLGTGGHQAAAGNDPRLSDQRVPLDQSVTIAKLEPHLVPTEAAGASDMAVRALGPEAGKAAPGTHHTQHAPTGADPIDYSLIHLRGTAAQMGVANPANSPYCFFIQTDTGDIYQSDGTQWIRIVIGSLRAAQYLPIASFPPSGAVDGLEVYIKLDQRTVWHVRYEAAEPTQYKWKCIGRQEPMYASLTGSVPLPASPGLMAQVQLPRSGEYRLEAGGVFDRPGSAAGGTHLNLGTGIGGTQGIQGEGWLDQTNGHTAQTVTVANDYAPAATGQSAAAYAYGANNDPSSPVNVIKAWVMAFPLRLA
jgi:hypothetical protein